MRSYSSWFRLCSRTTSGVTGRSPGNDSAEVTGPERGGAARPGSATPRPPPVAADGFERVVNDPPEEPGTILVLLDRIELARVQPEAAAVGAAFDLDPVVLAAHEVVSV